jgi:hypothetical protein
MNETAANPSAPRLAGPKRREGWPQKKWLAVIAIIFAAHVAIIFAFGEKKQIVPRPVTNVPALKLANDSDELPALNDPTLFALPHQRDFAPAARLKLPDAKPSSFRFMEPPHYLPAPDAENLGATFRQFMQTNNFATRALDFKPPPELGESVLPIEPAPAQNSTMQMTGELAQRRLLNAVNLPSLPWNDVIAPSKVQVLVDAGGNVFSWVLLPPGNALEAASRADIGETNAVQIARTLHFALAKNLTVGQIIFNWRTIPVTTTNDNSNAH